MEGVFGEVRKAIYDPSPVSKDLSYIDEILNSTNLTAAEKENFLTPFYLNLEKHIANEQAKKRISAQELRERIRISCHPEKCDSDFTLLFLPAGWARIRLFERFSEDIVMRAANVVSDAYAAFPGSNEFLSGVVKGDQFDWSGFEDRTSKISGAEEQEENSRQILAGGVGRVFDKLNSRLDVLRTEIIFRESFNKMKERFKFIGGEVPQILQIVPEAILKEERPEMLSREKLSGELKRRNEDLEFTLSQLREEKDKVEAERVKLAEALEDLKRLDSVKSEFIGIISHQFRTPLSAIRWNNDLITEELSGSGLPEEKSKQMAVYSGAIMNRTIFLISILEDIFDVLAVENKQLAIEKKPNFLWEMLDSAISAIAQEAKFKNIRINFNKNQASLMAVSSDKNKIERACMIMLRNAVNYSPENSEITVTLGSMEYRGKPAQFCTIKDNGIGIFPEDMAKLFTKFFRAKNAIAAVADGAGLGLYLVKQFLEAHGGTVGLESEIGKGSAFSIILPEE